MTSSIKVTKTILVFFIGLTLAPLFSQTHSTKFDSNVDMLKEFDANDPDIFKASFLLSKIDTLINKDFDFAQIGILKFNGREYFTMYGLKEITGHIDTVYSIISDFPCPKDCIPPSMIPKSSVTVNRAETILPHAFDKKHIKDVRWQQLSGIICINVRRAAHENQAALAIYAVTQDGTGLRERIDSKGNDAVFISVN